MTQSSLSVLVTHRTHPPSRMRLSRRKCLLFAYSANYTLLSTSFSADYHRTEIDIRNGCGLHPVPPSSICRQLKNIPFLPICYVHKNELFLWAVRSAKTLEHVDFFFPVASFVQVWVEREEHVSLAAMLWHRSRCCRSNQRPQQQLWVARRHVSSLCTMQIKSNRYYSVLLFYCLFMCITIEKALRKKFLRG